MSALRRRSRDHSHTARMEALESAIIGASGFVPVRPAAGQPIAWHLLTFAWHLPAPPAMLACGTEIPDRPALRRINAEAPRVNGGSVCGQCIEAIRGRHAGALSVSALADMMDAANALLDKEARSGAQPGRRKHPA